MLVGFICTKLRLIDDNSRKTLIDLLLCVFLPCSILSSFFFTSRSELPVFGIVFLISVLIIVFSFIFSKYIFYRKAKSEQKKVLIYATVVSNAGLIGTPMIEGIYGIDTLIYVAAYLIPIRVALWTIGVAIFAAQKSSIIKVIFHPSMIATYIGLLVIITGYTPFPLAHRVIFSLGGCLTPVSMIVVGSILGTVKPENLFTGWIAYFTVIRLILIPIMVMGIMTIFRLDSILLGVAVVLSGTPAGTTTSILADKYGSDREFASKIVFVTTLLSIFTIPALVFLLQYL